VEVKTPKGKPHWRLMFRRQIEIQILIRAIYPHCHISKKKRKLKIAYAISQCMVGEGARSPGQVRRRAQLVKEFYS
jgi:hypothetical protein